MITVRELYALWGSDAEFHPELGQSLDPRGPGWLLELFASLGPKPGDFVLDIGARDGKHLARLVTEHGVEGLALDPVPQSPDVVEGVIEALPVGDASADWIWCRDVLVHVDVEQGLAECARVLKPGGKMLAYVTLATELLEPREEQRLIDAIALTCLDGERIERASAAAGLVTEQKIELGGEWRERLIEDGEYDPTDSLLRLSRMRRLGIDSPHHEIDLTWGIYQLLGKLCPTVYVWSTTSSA